MARIPDETLLTGLEDAMKMNGMREAGLIAAMVIGAGRFTGARALAAAAGLTMACAIAPAGVITFSQLDWADELGGYTAQNSEWGRVGFDWTEADLSGFWPADGGGFYGYLNVVTAVPGATAPKWSVQNVPFFFGDSSELLGRSTDNLYFDLGTARGVDVGGLQFSYEISPARLAGMPSGGLSPIGVGADSTLFGGASLDGSTGIGAPGPAMDARGEGERKPSREDKHRIRAKDSDIPHVEEDVAGCVPGSIARSLKYLQQLDPSLSITGTAQEVYEDLKTPMEYTDGRGSPTARIVANKKKYTSDRRLPITTTDTTSPTEAASKVGIGADVEIVYTKKLLDGRLVSHMAFVTEILIEKNADGSISKVWVKTLDDDQKDKTKKKNESKKIGFNPDGTNDLGGRLQFYVVEVPSPGTLALLVMAGVVAVRRRRT